MHEPVPPASAAVIEALALSPNPAGGWFRVVLEEPDPGGGRPIMSVINYLLDAAEPIGHLHRMGADSMHYFHQGGPIDVVTVSPEGALTHTVLGPDLDAGQHLQVLVPGGHWKAFELLSGPWALISEAVVPGWTIEDHEDATSSSWEELSGLRDQIERFVPA